MPREAAMEKILTNPIERGIYEKWHPGKKRLQSGYMARDIPRLGHGSAAALQLMQEHLGEFKAELGKGNVLAMYAVGATGRGFPEHLAGKGRAVIVVREMPEEIPAKKYIKYEVITEKDLKALLAEDSAEARRHRMALSLNTIALHGRPKVQALRAVALYHVQESDFANYVNKHSRKEKERFESKNRNPPEDMRAHVRKEFGVDEALAKAAKLKEYALKGLT